MDFSVLLDIDKPFPIDDVLSSNISNEFVAILPRKWLEHYILSSYSDLSDLEKQFMRDVQRSIVYIEDKKCKTDKAFKYILSNFLLPTPVMGFFTQSIFAHIFEWITHSLPEDIHLGECAYRSKDNIPFIINTIACSRKIYFRLKKDSLVITKWLRIFKIDTFTDSVSNINNLFYVYIKFTIPLDQLEEDVQLEIEFYPEKNNEL